LTYSYEIRDVEPQSHKIEIEQMFPWHGTRSLRGEVAKKESEELREKFEAIKTRLYYKIKNTYFEYYYLFRAIDITKKNLELMTALEQSARIRYTSGKASYADVIQAQVEIARLEERLIGLNDLRNPFIADFNALLNRNIGDQLPPPTSIPDYVLTQSEESLQALMKEKNPELREFGIQIDRVTDRIDLAKKQFYPDIMIGLSYTRMDNAQMPGAKDPLMTMFSLNVPFRRDKYRAAVREAEVTRKSAVSSKTSLENDLQAALNRTLYTFRDAERKIDLYTDVLIPKAQEALDVSTFAYVTTEADFLSLLHAQSTLLDLELMYERALSDRALSFSQLEMLVGKDLVDGTTQ
jgi:outer membrane protein TolC